MGILQQVSHIFLGNTVVLYLTAECYKK